MFFIYKMNLSTSDHIHNTFFLRNLRKAQQACVMVHLAGNACQGQIFLIIGLIYRLRGEVNCE